MSNSNLGVSINNSHQSFFEDEEQFVRNHLLKEQHDSIFSLHKSNFLPKLNYWLLGSTSVEECYPSVLITARTSTKHNIVKLFICKVDSIGATRKHDLLVKFIVGDVGNEVSLENNIIKPQLVAIAMNECEVEMLCTDHLSPRSKKVRIT